MLFERNGEDMNQILTFKVGPESFCVDVHCVTGIDQSPKITSVPLSEKHLLGMMNLRGQIIPVVDLRILFNQEHGKKTKEQCFVFISTTKGKIACLVDAVYDVVDCSGIKFDQDNTFASGLQKEGYIENVFKLEDKIVFIINVDRIYNSVAAVGIDKITAA